MLHKIDLIQIEMAGEEVMDITLAKTDDLRKVCPYFNVGYCKYKSHCKHFHPSENCEERKCYDKNCNKRHKKSCMFGENCTRITSCEFLHQQKRRKSSDTDVPKTDQIKYLQELIDSKDVQILELTEKIKKLEKTVIKIKEETVKGS